MGSGQEWWSNEEARLRSEALQAQEERWIAFKEAHREELDRIKADPLRGIDAWGDRIDQLRTEFRAAERVRKELADPDRALNRAFLAALDANEAKSKEKK